MSENLVENAENSVESEVLEATKENKKGRKSKNAEVNAETEAQNSVSVENAPSEKDDLDELKGRKVIVVHSAKDIVVVCPDYFDSVLSTKIMTYAGNVRNKEPNVHELKLDDEGFKRLKQLVSQGYTISK